MPWKQMRTWYVDKRNPEKMFHTLKELFSSISEERPPQGKLPEYVIAIDAMSAEIARKKLNKIIGEN